MSWPASPVPGFRGEIQDVHVLPEGDDTLPAGPDLVRMAERALGYLARNPVAEHRWQCRFSFFLLHCPPFLPQVRSEHGLLDPIAIGDTESRNDLAFNQMREMCGSEVGREAQAAVHRRLVSYLRGDGGTIGDDLCWATPYCMSRDHDGPWAMIWTTAKLLQSETHLFRLTGDERHRALARRLFEGLRRVASWDTGRAFYPGGVRCLRDGHFASGYEGHYPPVIGPLLDYGRASGDPEALAFARAMAAGFLADLQPEHRHHPDGHVDGHNHVQMHAIRGMAQLGTLTGDWRYADWARAAYDHFAASAFDTGWLPEIAQWPDHRHHSETCLTADMLEVEVWLACAGWPEYWDRVDRTVRNYLVPAQFSLTPEIEAFWRAVNRHRSTREVAAGLALLHALEGGFLSALTPNDRVFEVRPGGTHHGEVTFRGRRLVLDMMGCCPPEGMRGIYLAWANTVQATPDGVLVNLPLDHDGATATVRSGLPRQGRLRATARGATDFWLRPPGWAPRAQVEAWRNGRRIEARWGGPALHYIGFGAVRPGEVVEITWPLVRFRQQVVERSVEGEVVRRFDYHWVGSTVTAVEPAGAWLPLYS